MVSRCHARGMKVMAMVTTVDDARTLEHHGVDVLVAQGSEAGGHRSIWVKRPTHELAAIGTLALVPQIVDAVRAPVIAAGGIADGRGLVAALALGAVGVLLGTRFVATREAGVPEFQKKALLEAEAEATTMTDAITGLWARYLRNMYTSEYAASGAPVFPALVQSRAAARHLRPRGQAGRSRLVSDADGTERGTHSRPAGGRRGRRAGDRPRPAPCWSGCSARRAER